MLFLPGSSAPKHRSSLSAAVLNCPSSLFKLGKFFWEDQKRSDWSTSCRSHIFGIICPQPNLRFGGLSWRTDAREKSVEQVMLTSGGRTAGGVSARLPAAVRQQRAGAWRTITDGGQLGGGHQHSGLLLSHRTPDTQETSIDIITGRLADAFLSDPDPTKKGHKTRLKSNN